MRRFWLCLCTILLACFVCECLADVVLLDNGDRLTGMMGCPEPGAPGPTMARLDGNYGPTGYDLRMEMTSPLPDGTPLTLEVRTRGRRIGECREGEIK